MKTAQELAAGTEGKTYEVRFKFRVFDEEGLALAFEDLENAKVYTGSVKAAKRTVKENLAAIIRNLDVLAEFRELETLSFLDMGFEEIE